MSTKHPTTNLPRKGTQPKPPPPSKPDRRALAEPRADVELALRWAREADARKAAAQ
ncbi:hypothetical protein [Embleya sp. NPDC020630]|uniref:hypothetical protein n=1 Tax=Embleya sp. NPDC020630 TaxID=3363979 RepID=UPI0037AB4F65